MADRGSTEASAGRRSPGFAARVAYAGHPNKGATARRLVQAVTTYLVPMTAALGMGAAAAALGSDRPHLALVLCLAPLLPLFVVHTQAAATAAMACLPFDANIIGDAVGGLNVSVNDLLFAACFGGLALAFSADAQVRQRLTILRPILPLLILYVGAAFIVAAAHPSTRGMIQLVQRLEVVGLPLLVGAVLLTSRRARRALALFVMAALVLGLRWLLPHSEGSLFGVQKNPAGQYLADAALIALVVFDDKRLRFAVFPILVLGLFATQSRGALIGLGAGLLVFTVLRSTDPFRFALRLSLLLLLVVGTYALLPAGTQARLAGSTPSADFNDSVREAYTRDAREIIDAHLVVGVGIGNYVSGKASDLTLTTDPHNIVLLETAEGGMVLITAFVVLQLGALVIVFRRRKKSPWAVPALSVQVGILAHALVDVYWVRGTPVAGWLLIGLALAPFTPPVAGGTVIAPWTIRRHGARTAR